MYHAHFGLQKGLFGDGIAADTAVFRSSRHDQIIAHFKLALGSPSSCIVLRGPAGVGKTTLTAATLRASSTRLAIAWLNGTPTNATELLELVLVELGINTIRTTRIERLQLWRQFQAEMRATDSRLFIVVERTEDLSVEVLHALDQLTAPDAMGNPGANVVLLGHATIDEHLAAPLLDSLRQRIRVRTDLTPFTEAELQDYLRHQVACAGGRYEQIFAPGTVAALYRHSDGVTRLANTLCETALDFAAGQQLKQLTPELVTKTAVSLLGLAAAPPATRVAPPAAAGPATSAAGVAPVVLPTVHLEVMALTPTMVAVPPAAAAPAPAAAAPVAATVVATPVAATVTAAPPQAPSSAAPPAPGPRTTTAGAPPPPAATVAAAAPSRAPVTSAAPRPTAAAAPAPAPAKPEPVDFEFDGTATDISDVAIVDFPVLTDAVEQPVPAPVKRPAAAAPQPEPAPLAPRAPAQKPAAAPRTAAAAAAAKPVAPARVETAYATQKTSAAPAAPKPAAAPAAAPPKPAAPAPQRSEPADDDDLLRQTQTMRAIAVAKSIDDISSSMAETLFGDAELDLVTAALASAAEWPDDDALDASAAGKPEPAKAAAKPEPAKAPAPVDDPFDLFGLGDDAPLELIDDSTLPPMAPKRAAR